jgi:hypothetical protein
MAVHAVEPRRDPAAARLEEPDPQIRMALANPAPDHAHAGQHHLHRVRDDMLRAAALETVNANGWHAAVAALVDADRKVEFLGGAPQRLISGVVELSVVVRVGADKAAAKAELLARKPHLGDCVIDRLQRQHRNTEQPVGVRFAVIR